MRDIERIISPKWLEKVKIHPLKKFKLCRKTGAGVMEHTKYKILLIEDNLLDRMAFERFVDEQELHHDCKAVSSISEAKKILKAEQFDIIISDYSLGDGTALDILNSIKDIPVILITAAEEEEVADNVMRAGAYDCLPKDLDRNYLKAVPQIIENAVCCRTK